MLAKINKPEALKVAGFVLMVASAFFAPVEVKVPFFIGATGCLIGYAWSRLTA